MTTIATEFVYPPSQESPDNPCEGMNDLWVLVAFSEAVFTFARDDQLIGSVEEGYLCLDPTSGKFYGQVKGTFEGGTGRFRHASGYFESPFKGKNLTLLKGLPFTFGPVQGVAKGRVYLH